MTAKSIQKELDALDGRRDKLQRDLEAARVDLESAQSDLIDGKGGAEEAAELVQARVNSLEGTLRLLAGRIEAKSEELHRATEAESRTAAMKRIEALAAEASAIRKDQEERLRLLAEQLDTAHAGSREAAERLHAIRTEILTAFSSALQGDGDALEEIEAEGTSLDDALTGYGKRDGLPRHYNVEIPNHGRFGGSLRKLLADAAEADHYRERRAAKVERDAARAA